MSVARKPQMTGSEPEMFILAIELSTSTGSVALLEGSGLMAGRTWKENGGRNQFLFTALPAVLQEAHLDAGSVDVFAVGFGPGSFSGIRVSLSAARAMALPGEKPVGGITSGEAIARDIQQEESSTRIVVVGDARRNRLWFAVFEEVEDELRTVVPYALTSPAELPAQLRRGSTLVTPDWDRIGGTLKEVTPGNVTLIEEQRVPRAQTVGKTVLLKRKSGSQMEPLQPVYMHPPVLKHQGSAFPGYR